MIQFPPFAGRRVALAASLAATAGTTHALVIVNPDASNASPTPASGFADAFAHVGRLGVGNGVYLGNRWVLTAAHVGAGSIQLGGTSYAKDGGTDAEKIFVPGTTTEVDLLLFRLATDPGLPGVSITADAAAVTNDVRLAAGGRLQTGLTFWDVDETADPPDWTEVASPGPGEFRVYQTGSTRGARWGDNRVSGLDDVSGSSDARLDATDVFRTRFDEAGSPSGDAVTYEAQAVANDSGGAGFAVDPVTGEWMLDGLILAVSTFKEQPGGTTSAAFNQATGGETFLADLSVYRDQIVAIIPEPASLLAAAAAFPVLLRRRRVTA